MKEPTNLDVAKTVVHTTLLGGLTMFNGWHLYHLAKKTVPAPIKLGIYAVETIHLGHETIKGIHHTTEVIKQHQKIK